MKIGGTITPADYVAAQYLNLRPRMIIKWCGLAFVGFAVLACIIMLTAPSPERHALALGAIIGGGGYLAAWYRFILPWKTKRIFWQQKSLQAPWEAEITSDGLSIASDIGSFSMPWKDFHKYKIGKELILIYHSELLFQMFPRRFFKGSAFEEFEELLRLKLGPPQH